MHVRHRDVGGPGERIGEAQRVMVLDDARSQDVERHIPGQDRIVALAIAGTDGQRAVDRVLQSELPDIDVLPAEAGAVARAQRGLVGARVADGVDVVVVDALVVHPERQRGLSLIHI